VECLKRKIKSYLLCHIDYVLKDIIVHIDNRKAYFPGGHNGPYMNPETPIRNTSHIIVYLSNLIASGIDDTLQSKYKACLNKLYTYLVDENPYFINSQYIHRGLSIDSCNGVIGDAWILEALLIDEAVLDSFNLKKKAIVSSAIINRLKFNKEINFAYRFDALKGELSADFTYNHQLWLAASLVRSESNIGDLFLNNLLACSASGVLKTRDNGLINHLYHGNTLKNVLNRLAYVRANLRFPKKINYKERGYHLFNLLAFTNIKKLSPNHAFFSSPLFVDAINFVDIDFLTELRTEDNIYGSSYNMSLFELPSIYIQFFEQMKNKISLDEMHKFIDSEIALNWSEEHKCFLNNNVDQMTFIARAYELSYSL